jgi:FkbH-like protein
MSAPALYWLPECSDWKEGISALGREADPWPRLTQLANTRLDFVRTNQLDHHLQRSIPESSPPHAGTKTIRLAVLSSCTATHLLPGLRIAMLRRNINAQVYVTGYGQYYQELLDPASHLHQFRPNVVLFALDTRHLVGKLADTSPGMVEKAVSQLAELWRMAGNAFGCQLIQQTLLPVFPQIIGGNEHRLRTSRHARVNAFNHGIRCHADSMGIDALSIDASVAQHGLDAWYDDGLWHRAKQEIHPAAAPLYGDLVARLIAAQLGRSSKCLVLDLDNTMWGGVIGDDGLEGIVLGQGSALGEAYVEFQAWVLEQARRGVVLAVCSKNDEANALAPFESHPEMALSRSDIAIFIANWEDKATNLRTIANRLNIGIDSLVFVDDSPFERNIVRRELPMVAVPEIPEDPALYARCIADAGYFEAISVTVDDLERTRQYQANQQRENLQATATDLNSYLASLKMEMWAAPFDRVNLKRIVQLINKTNQFNLTTRRYTEEEVANLIGATDILTLHFRLTDSFGDNGIIGIIVGRLDETDRQRMTIDTWLMSCRVLGRQVENACMNAVAAGAKRLGATEIIGEYIRTAKNGMVREHYKKLSFLRVEQSSDERSVWRLALGSYVPFETFIVIHED